MSIEYFREQVESILELDADGEWDDAMQGVDAVCHEFIRLAANNVFDAVELSEIAEELLRLID